VQHQTANRSYLEASVQLLNLANCGYDLFGKQPPSEKRRLFNLELSKCTSKGDELSANSPQLFNLLSSTRITQSAKAPPSASLSADMKIGSSSFTRIELCVLSRLKNREELLPSSMS